MFLPYVEENIIVKIKKKNLKNKNKKQRPVFPHGIQGSHKFWAIADGKWRRSSILNFPAHVVLYMY